jgi:hypothetical protein
VRRSWLRAVGRLEWEGFLVVSELLLTKHYAISTLLLHSPKPRGAKLVGLSRFELLTPRLSSVCSNQLSYRPGVSNECAVKELGPLPVLSKLDRALSHKTCSRVVPDRSFRVRLRPDGLRRDCSRKEVIQPQVLLQLPCYDFTPITDHTLGACFPCGLARRLLVQPAFVM